ncbi:MAG: hypothetical protein ACI9US_000309 [Gammaproteobacteria bacterium]|jgi:hypothetical protein
MAKLGGQDNGVDTIAGARRSDSTHVYAVDALQAQPSFTPR